jgi:DNA (cytosine-5)-methyltransferase 1
MTHASLFSGIGGFDLAAEWAGFTNVFNCEWEEFPQKILKYHFPNAEQYGDIHDFDATKYNGRIDILSGGFPCQPFSVAGKRKGTEDERYLWKEMLRVIRECKPRWIVGENVRGIYSWSNGLVLEACYSDLENLGYSVQSFIIPACATNAPHRRDRVWIVAHSDNFRTTRDASNTDSATRKSERINRQGKGEFIRRSSNTIQDRWEKFPTVPPVCGGDDGLPKELDGITVSKWRRESIKGYGNAIVPQVAHRIFESIKEYEHL